MGGDIHLESRIDVGTKAYVTIPLKKIGSSPSMPPPIMISEPASLDHQRPPSRKLSPRPSLFTGGRAQTTCISDSDAAGKQKKNQLTAKHLELVAQYPLTKRGNIHILLAEDNAINQTVAIKAIRKLGFPVTAVSNGKEALDYLTDLSDSCRSQTSIVLMDCQMPVLGMTILGVAPNVRTIC